MEIEGPATRAMNRERTSALERSILRDRVDTQNENSAQSNGPQLLSRLTECARGLHELSCRLGNVSQKIRGSIPSKEGATDASIKPAEHTLLLVSTDIEKFLEYCHNEVAEISALLS